MKQNMMKAILQTKVLDKDFQIESDVWRQPKKIDTPTPFNGE